jgi:hypothetical protein
VHTDQAVQVVGLLIAAAWPIVRAYIKTKLTPERLAHVQDIARIAVRAAEQIGEDYGALLTQGQPEGTTAGAAKLKFATQAVYAGAKRLGIKLTEPEIDAAIHAALREMNGLAGVESIGKAA